jgi:molybdenum cofactor cytidylyltransferase
MLISRALRLRRKEVIALAGGGGKTTLMFRLAAELAGGGSRVVTTMTTRIFVGQMALAPAHLIWQDEETRGHGDAETRRDSPLPRLSAPQLDALHELLSRFRHVLLAGGVLVEQDKVSGLPPELVDRIAQDRFVDAVIVEADGSRRLPFKAPADHEPVIPDRTTIVVPVAGMDVLGRALTPENVHRPQLVAALAGAAPGEPVTAEIVAAVLAHPQGGAKSAPAGARLIPFLNKVEDDAALASARVTAQILLANPRVDSVLIGSAASGDPVREVWSRVGAVVLAAGSASRFGALKQAMPWGAKPLVAHVADQALGCPDIARVAVTMGAGADAVRMAIGQRDVLAVPVPDWAAGQSRSVRMGLEALAADGRPPLGAVLFLLADQPGITPALLSALIQRHRETLAPVVAPRYLGRRGNPVLFDRAAFNEFTRLEGDIGARPILHAHQDEIAWVDWPTPEVVQDIDTTADYHPPASD